MDFGTFRDVTLAELLIALLILAEIATFAIPKNLSSQQNASYNAQKDILSALGAILNMKKANGTLSLSTIPEDILSEVNSVARVSTGSIDQSYGYGTLSCASNPCYRLHNEGIVGVPYSV